MDSNWYIAIINPNCHRRAEAGLAALDYRAFWPKLRKWVSHARTKTAKEYPILGRYLFVEIPDGNFWSVRNVHGVEALLTGDNGAPARVPASVVTGFLERYLQGEWDFAAKQEIPTGARVRVMEGEFANLLTIVRGRVRGGRIKFLPPGRREFVFTRAENVRAA
jgi:transcription antitermination factor NusG